MTAVRVSQGDWQPRYEDGAAAAFQLCITRPEPGGETSRVQEDQAPWSNPPPPQREEPPGLRVRVPSIVLLLIVCCGHLWVTRHVSQRSTSGGFSENADSNTHNSLPPIETKEEVLVVL